MEAVVVDRSDFGNYFLFEIDYNSQMTLVVVVVAAVGEAKEDDALTNSY